MAKVFVTGCGWGTALALLCERNGHHTTLWSPFAEELEQIRLHGEQKKLLPGVPVPPSIELSNDVADAADADLVIMAVPSFAVEKTAQLLAPHLRAGIPVVNAGKGLEPNTHRRLSVVLQQALPHANVAVLSGPSHAEEVGRCVPTSVVCAAFDHEVAVQVQQLLTTPEFRIYVCDDIIGVELGGAFKNIIALAAGICDGLDVGDNAKAALMTRGLAEIARLGVRMGAKEVTFAGLSGMGDLIVTCGSMHSRNRRAGMLIGQGFSADEAVRRVGTVEGYHASKAAFEVAKQLGVEMPITEQCYAICYEGRSAVEGMRALLSRPGRAERESLWMA